MSLTIETNPRKRPRFWTDERVWRLAEMLENGHTDDEIARVIGTTAQAVRMARKRRHIKSRTTLTYSTRAVAALLDVRCAKTIVRWIEHGYLFGRRGQRRGANRQWMVTREALIYFLENPEHWHRWSPERIDPASNLQWWAREMRQGVRFLTQAEVADRFCVQTPTVAQWIDRGQLPSYSGSHRMIRESDLVGFVPPGQRFRGGYRIRHWTADDDAQLLALRASGMTWTRIGDTLGRSLGAVSNHYHLLTAVRP